MARRTRFASAPFALAVLSSGAALAQPPESGVLRLEDRGPRQRAERSSDAAYVEAGGPGLLSLNYEHAFNDSWLRVYAGPGLGPELGPAAGSGVGWLAGAGSHHLDVGVVVGVVNANLGCSTAYRDNNCTPRLYPIWSPSIGWRFQPSRGGPVLRAVFSPVFFYFLFPLPFGGVSAGWAF